jgi:hypothetical protein
LIDKAVNGYTIRLVARKETQKAPHPTRRAGLPVRLWKQVEAFRKAYKYTCWHVEASDELTFYDGSEPFSWREYEKGSRIRISWKRLERLVQGELSRARKVVGK